MALESSLGRNLGSAVTYLTHLSASPQFQGHCCRPLMRAKLWCYRVRVRVPLGPRERGVDCREAPGAATEPPGQCVSLRKACPPWLERLFLTCLPLTVVLSSLAVHFRYVVFHPFLDEILIGKIKGCSPEGVHGN